MAPEFENLPATSAADMVESGIPTPEKKPSIPDYFRGIRAAVNALGVLTPYALELYRQAIFQPHKKPWKGNHGPARAIPKSVAYWIDKMCREQILGIRMEIENNLPDYDEDERVIVYANHPTSNAVFSVLNVMAQNIQPELSGVAKSDLLKWNNLFYGIPIAWPCKLSGNMIFVDRENSERAIASIREACETIFRPGSMVIIFPDAHRPSPKNIAADQKKFAGKIDHAERWEFMCPPRFKGLYELIKGTEGMNRRVARTFNSFDREDHGKLGAAKVVGATLHAHLDDVTDKIPTESEDDLRDWLMEDFWQMHEKRRAMLNGYGKLPAWPKQLSLPSSSELD